MLKRYIKFKLKSDEFINNTKNIIKTLEGKRVIVIYDNKKTFVLLNKVFNFSKKMEIVHKAITNKDKTDLDYLTNFNYDAILVFCENNPDDFVYKTNCILEDKNTPIYAIFKENLKDTQINLEYLLKYNVEKSIKNLNKSLKNKKIILYGGGLLFKLINEYYDLSNLNIIGIADKKLSKINELNNICGYKLYSPDNIKDLNPDYIIITTKRHLETANELYEQYLKHSNIKIIPLVKKNLFSTLRGC